MSIRAIGCAGTVALFPCSEQAMSILGVIVRVQPADAGEVEVLLNAMPGLDIAAAEQGRFVTVIEDSAESSAAATMARITLLAQVLNTSLVYEYSGPDSPAPDGPGVDFQAWRAHPETWVRNQP
jgi:periplasmic nitrate reductase NapD